VLLLEPKLIDKIIKHKWRKDSKKQTEKYNQLILEWKSQGCSKCNEKRPHTIDAHHINPKEKSFMVGTVKRGIKITKEELKKCIPLCSNLPQRFSLFRKENGDKHKRVRIFRSR
jgi:hypothetical protein